MRPLQTSRAVQMQRRIASSRRSSGASGAGAAGASGTSAGPRVSPRPRISADSSTLPSSRTLPISGAIDERGCGMLLGGAVGDCVGLPAENLPRWLVRLRYPSGPALRRGLVRFFRRAGDVSDDTQLTIAVARSILPDGQYSHAHFRAELRAWYAFRVAAGRATSEAASRLWRDRDAPSRPSSSQGNGVCIRIANTASICRG